VSLASTIFAMAMLSFGILDDDRIDDQVGLEPHFLERLQVGQVRGRDEQPVTALVQRQHPAQHQHLGVDPVPGNLREVVSVQVQQRDAEGAGGEFPPAPTPSSAC